MKKKQRKLKKASNNNSPNVFSHVLKGLLSVIWVACGEPGHFGDSIFIFFCIPAHFQRDTHGVWWLLLCSADGINSATYAESLNPLPRVTFDLNYSKIIRYYFCVFNSRQMKLLPALLHGSCYELLSVPCLSCQWYLKPNRRQINEFTFLMLWRNNSSVFFPTPYTILSAWQLSDIYRLSHK